MVVSDSPQVPVNSRSRSETKWTRSSLGINQSHFSQWEGFKVKLCSQRSLKDQNKMLNIGL